LGYRPVMMVVGMIDGISHFPNMYLENYNISETIIYNYCQVYVTFVVYVY